MPSTAEYNLIAILEIDRKDRILKIQNTIKEIDMERGKMIDELINLEEAICRLDQEVSSLVEELRELNR